MKKEKRMVTYKLGELPPLTNKDRKQLAALRDRPIDLSDIPEISDEQWENAVAMPPMTQFKSAKEYHAYYQKALKAKKKAKGTVALEPEVSRWFKAHSKDYQAGINAALRLYILAHEHKL